MPKIRRRVAPPLPQFCETTTLEKIEERIVELQAEIEARKFEIRRLEDAAAIIRSIEGIDNNKPFAGLTIVQCAQILLRERSPQNYKSLAQQAVARGYVSQKGGDKDAIAKSFFTAMTSAGMTFCRIGQGNFSLSDLAKKEMEIAEGRGSD